jgi:tRNA nucleotidyltransferase (CCA-adding enzyme)
VTTFHLDENGVGHFWGHNEASAKRAREFFNEYKYDNFTKERVCEIIAQHDTHIKADKIEIKKRLHNMGKESFLELLELQKADNVAQNPEKTNMKHFDTVLEIYNSIIENNECFNLKTLALNGSDLIQNGFDKGKTVGNVLEYLLNEVIEEKIPNDKQKLLEMAKERFLK